MAILLFGATLALGACGRTSTSNAKFVVGQLGARLSSVQPASPFTPVPDGMLFHAQSVSNCNVDKINGQIAANMAIDHLGDAVFSGWVVNEVMRSVPADIRVVLIGPRSYWLAGRTGVSRPDVAAARHNPAFSAAGFLVTGATNALPIGQYSVAVAYESAGHWFVCETVQVSLQ